MEYGGEPNSTLVLSQKLGACDQNWAPCTCTNQAISVDILCDQTNVVDVIEVFNRTDVLQPLSNLFFSNFKHDEVGIPD